MRRRPRRRDSTRLEPLLDEALVWSDDRGHADLKDLRERLDAAVVRVLLVGEAKRGKSTLANALLGRDVLPSGVLPVTAITTTIAPGSPERVVVELCDGRQVERPIDDLAEYVTEVGNPGNHRAVAAAHVVLDEVGLPGYVLVDTPGVGSVFTHNTEEARHAMGTMDLAVFVLTADPPISDTERRLLDQVRGLSVATFIVLNKADRLTPEELAEARAFVADVTRAEATGAEVFVCSARAGLAARLRDDAAAFRASGVAALAEALAARVAGRGELDLAASVAAATERVLDGVADRVTITRAAVDAVANDREADVELFAAEIPRLAGSDDQVLAAVAWTQSQFRHRLDQDADRQVVALTHQVRAEVSAGLEGRSSLSPEERAAQLRAAAIDVVAASVDSWRGRWLSELETDLRRLAGQQEAFLQATADRVRESALRLLGAAVDANVDPLPVPDVGRFTFDFSVPVAWDAALVEGARRLLPPVWRRRVAGRRLLEEVAVLVDRQVGRARSDVQRRLEAATRQQSGLVVARFRSLREDLTAALDAARAAQGGSSAEHAAQVAALDEQLAALTRLRMQLRGGPKHPAGTASFSADADPAASAVPPAPGDAGGGRAERRPIR